MEKMKGLFIPSKLLLSQSLSTCEKICYAYVLFRLEHPTVQWTLSVEDIAQSLGIVYNTADKFVKNGLKLGFFSKGEKTKCFRGWYYVYIINRERFLDYYNHLPVEGVEQLTCSQNEPLNDGTCSQNEPLNEADLLKKWKRPAQKEGVQEVVVKEVVSKSTRNSGKTFGLSDEVIGNFGLTDEEIDAQQNRKTMEIRNNLGAAGKDFMYDRESAINDLKIQKQQLDALNQLKRK